MSLWTVENNYLRASFDILCSDKRQMVCFSFLHIILLPTTHLILITYTHIYTWSLVMISQVLLLHLFNGLFTRKPR